MTNYLRSTKRKSLLIKYFLDKVKYGITFCLDKRDPTIADDLEKLFSDKKILLIIDKNISQDVLNNLFDDLRVSGFSIFTLFVDGEKKNKNEKLLFKILDELINKSFTKKSVIISCGGGVIGDVSALAASLYYRGVIYFHIPTTMTAIVDSCIGGKTAINYRGIINAIGNYYHPRNVYISKNIINLIPQKEYVAGFSEIIKYGFIDNKKILSLIKKNKNKYFNRDFNALSQIIFLCLKSKIKLFKDDIFENKKRLNLNFGHTFAHAIEMALGNINKGHLLRHGEAVGIGMLCEIYYCSGLSKNFFELKKLLRLFNLPFGLKNIISKKTFIKLQTDIYKNIFLDKKKIKDYPRYIKINTLGKASIDYLNDFSKIKNTIKKIIFR